MTSVRLSFVCRCRFCVGFSKKSAIRRFCQMLQKVAKAKQKPLKSCDSSGKFWSCWADSNRRPHPYQGCALPTELQQHNMATKKGLEPSTSSVTGWRSNQLNYLAICAFVLELKLAYYSKNICECQHLFLRFFAIRGGEAGNRIVKQLFL